MNKREERRKQFQQNQLTTRDVQYGMINQTFLDKLRLEYEETTKELKMEPESEQVSRIILEDDFVQQDNHFSILNIEDSSHVNSQNTSIYFQNVIEDENEIINASFISNELEKETKEKNILKKSMENTTDFETASENFKTDTQKLVKITAYNALNDVFKEINLGNQLEIKSEEEIKNPKDSLNFLVNDLNNFESIRYRKRNDQMKKRKELFDEKTSKKSYEKEVDDSPTHKEEKSFIILTKQYKEYEEKSNINLGYSLTESKKNVQSCNFNKINSNIDEDLTKNNNCEENNKYNDFICNSFKKVTKLEDFKKYDQIISTKKKPKLSIEIDIEKVEEKNERKEEKELYLSDLEYKYSEDGISPKNINLKRTTPTEKKSSKSQGSNILNNQFKKRLTNSITDSIINFKNMLKYKNYSKQLNSNFTNSYLMALGADSDYQEPIKNDFHVEENQIIREVSEGSCSSGNKSVISKTKLKNIYSEINIKQYDSDDNEFCKRTKKFSCHEFTNIDNQLQISHIKQRNSLAKHKNSFKFSFSNQENNNENNASYKDLYISGNSLIENTPEKNPFDEIVSKKLNFNDFFLDANNSDCADNLSPRSKINDNKMSFIIDSSLIDNEEELDGEKKIIFEDEF